jgi:hypothetical protein
MSEKEKLTSRVVANRMTAIITNNGAEVVRPPWGASAELVDYLDGHFRRLQIEFKIKPGRGSYSSSDVVRMLHRLVEESERSISLRGLRLRHVRMGYDVAQKTAVQLGVAKEFDEYE